MSFGLKQLSSDDRSKLVNELWAIQGGRCFISEKPIDLTLHANDLDIDHVIPTRDGGKDDKSNWALTFSHYNRSKQAADLRVARILARLEGIKASVSDPRGVNLGHVLHQAGGAKTPLKFVLDEAAGAIRYSLSATGSPDVVTAPRMDR